MELQVLGEHLSRYSLVGTLGGKRCSRAFEDGEATPNFFKYERIVQALSKLSPMYSLLTMSEESFLEHRTPI
ncbi:uncharacterized protein J3R85_011323 [Psidium guajava]|nr:uncharacterized protein J3R85_011323 [Psidium guajava]